MNRHPTPPELPRKRGAVPLIIAASLSAAFFTAVPLTQYIQGEPSVVSPYIKAPINPPPAPPIDPPLVQETRNKEDTPELKQTPPPAPQLNWSPFDGLGGLGMPVFGGVEIPIYEAPDILLPDQLDNPPEPIRKAEPILSFASKRMNAEVQVLIVVDPSGRVVSAQVRRSTNRQLNDAAVEAAKKWVFKPGTVEGQPVTFKLLLPFVFQGQ